MWESLAQLDQWILSHVSWTSLSISLLVLLITWCWWPSPPRKRPLAEGALPGEWVPPKETYSIPAWKEYSLEELKQFNGENGQAILVCVRGRVFDMTSHETGRLFYGDGSAYRVFAGLDASRSLATMDFEDAGNGNLEGLSNYQKQTLEQWEELYKDKYKVVGKIVPYKYAYAPGIESGPELKSSS